MSEEPVSTPPAPEKPSLKWPDSKQFSDFYEKSIRPFVQSFFPKPHYLEGETVQQKIRMAQYRAEMPRIFATAGVVLLVPALVAFIFLAVFGSDASKMVAAIFTILALLLLYEAAESWMAYHQWQVIVTNKRFILITPDPNRKGFADVIYLKAGKIQVLDTNFSRSPVWGLFQILTGSRDVMLSLSGYEFVESGAKVKGGLRFPDVKVEDIDRLEQLVFG